MTADNHDAEAARLLAEALHKAQIDCGTVNNPTGYGLDLRHKSQARAILAALDGEVVPKGTLDRLDEAFDRWVQWIVAKGDPDYEDNALIGAIYAERGRRRALLALGEPVEKEDGSERPRH